MSYLTNKGVVFVAALAVSGIAGCAGSATHEVVTANQATDTSLTCQQIDSDIIKTQMIIDDVNKDKADVSGADVVDGILWFPFNLIAKSSNYSSALEAADKRMGKLNELKKENNCPSQNNKTTSVSVTETAPATVLK